MFVEYSVLFLGVSQQMLFTQNDGDSRPVYFAISGLVSGVYCFSVRESVEVVIVTRRLEDLYEEDASRRS